MTDIIFGKLDTTQGRAAHASQQRRGVRHGHQMQPLAPGPGDRPTVMVTVGLDRPVEEVLCRVTAPTPLTIPLEPVDIAWDTLNWHYVQRWQAVLPPQADGTVVRYMIEAIPGDGGEPVPADDGATFSYRVGDPRPPDWSKEAIIYQILPDRFHPGPGSQWTQIQNLDAVCGGTLRGIIDHLDYVADLGFNCLWLNPFFPDQTHHGYHATDYFSVNPRLGTADEMHELVATAHAKGIRLLLDFVANHWGSGHATFQDALANRNSVYHDWYFWKEWPSAYETYFSVLDLPKVNVDNPAARAYLLEAAQYWLTEFDFDGLRLDYALGPSHDFWTDLRVAAQQAKADVWLFGEVVETPDTQLSYWGRFHGCLDFMLEQALRAVFALGTMDLSAFETFLQRHEAFFPTEFSRPSFLDNHDINRFLWLAGGDKRRLQLAALCQFTLVGPPIVYYGTEVGLSQERDMIQPDGRHLMAEARLPMIWGDAQDGTLRDYYRWLIQLRRQHPALRSGQRQTVHLDAPAGTYAYRRSDESESLVVAFNVGDCRQSFEAGGCRFDLEPWAGDVQVAATA